MAIGDKIKNIRMLREMTQKELGIAVGLPAKSADVRIAQYEIGARVPKEKLVEKIAEALNVKAEYLTAPAGSGKEEVMRFLFDLDSYGLLDLHLNDTKDDVMADKISVTFSYIDNLLEEWYEQKSFLEKGVITEEQYEDWKLNWCQEQSDWKGMPMLVWDDE